MYAQNCKINYLKYFDYRGYSSNTKCIHMQCTQAYAHMCSQTCPGIHLFGGLVTCNFSPLKHTKNYNDNASE